MARTWLDAYYFRGIPLAATAPTNGQVYVYNSTSMEREPQDQWGGGWGWTVTSVSVVNANWFNWSVADPTTTPAITITTTATGMLKWNGTAISGVTGTTNELTYWVDANTIGALTVATYPSLAELAFVKWVTSAIQTQLNAKQATISFGTGVQTALGVNIGSAWAVVLFNGALGTPSSGNLANCTFPTLNQNTTGSAATLTTTRTIWWQNFNWSANVTGTLALGASSLTMTGSIAATGARVTKWWFTDLESTNMPTVWWVAILSSLTAPTFNTIEVGTWQTDTTISRLSGWVLGVEWIAIPSISSTNTFTNKRITRRLTTTNAPWATPTTNTDNVDIMKFTGLATAITSMSTNLSGTPVEGDKIEFIFLDNGTARAITRWASFAATTVPLPTTTVISTKLRVWFEWGGSTRDCIAVA